MEEVTENSNEIIEEKRRELETELIRLHRASKQASMERKPLEEVVEIGKAFEKARQKFEDLGGSWEDVKRRNEDQMFAEIEEKRKN